MWSTWSYRVSGTGIPPEDLDAWHERIVIFHRAVRCHVGCGSAEGHSSIGLVRFSRPVTAEDAEFLVMELHAAPGSYVRVDSVPPGLGREFADALARANDRVYFYHGGVYSQYRYGDADLN